MKRFTVIIVALMIVGIVGIVHAQPDQFKVEVSQELNLDTLDFSSDFQEPVVSVLAKKGLYKNFGATLLVTGNFNNLTDFDGGNVDGEVWYRFVDTKLKMETGIGDGLKANDHGNLTHSNKQNVFVRAYYLW